MKRILLTIAVMLLPLLASAAAVEINGIYYNLIGKAGQAEVTTNPNKYTGSVVIPESVVYEGKKYSVASIGQQAFAYCYDLTSVTIPNSVASIGQKAFYQCSGLISLTIPNSVTSIGMFAFQNCSSLTSLTIPNSVTSIDWYAFADCSGLTSVTIPSSVTTISERVFSGCSGLTSLTIPNSVTTIGPGAFEGCSGLTSLTIPNSVTYIDYFAFRGCSGLTSVTMGSGVKTIWQEAFAGCKELKDVYCLAKNVPNAYTDAFKDSYPEYTTLHVRKASLNNYKQTEPWKSFGNILRIDMPEYTLCYLVNGEVYKEYTYEEDDDITPEPAPTKEGYTFSGWSDIPSTMPAHDVTITGTFTVNKYKLVYKVDGVEYKSYDVEYGASITPEAAPTKEGYTFSGWSDIPSTMPAHDVTITGTFTVNKYKLVYKVDGVEYKSYDVEYGASITPEAAPTKEGYTFSGWSEIPETMPAKDVIVTGKFTIIPLGKCATPTIRMKNGKIIFECETEGVEYVPQVTPLNEYVYSDGEIQLPNKYRITVYATKEAYYDSDVVSKDIELIVGVKGDVNKDGKVDVADHVELSKIILNQEQ